MEQTPFELTPKQKGILATLSRETDRQNKRHFRVGVSDAPSRYLAPNGESSLYIANLQGLTERSDPAVPEAGGGPAPHDAGRHAAFDGVASSP